MNITTNYCKECLVLTERIAELEEELRVQPGYLKYGRQQFNAGMERAADMLDLNYPLCAKWIRKEIEK